MNTAPASTIRFGSGLFAAIALVLMPLHTSAQAMDPSMQMPMNMPMPAQKPPAKAKAMPKKTVPEKAGRKKSIPKQSATPMDAPKVHHPAPATTPAASMDMANMSDMSNMPGMNHAIAMPMPNAPRVPVPTLTDADRAAAFQQVSMHAMRDNAINNYILVDRIEAGARDVSWEGRGWIGTDRDRLWLRSEGERRDGRSENADVEILYGHAIARWWDLYAGARHDIDHGGSIDFVAFGIMGLAPQKFEVEATAYFGDGDSSLRIEIERDLLLTNRWILQPRVEIDAFGNDDPLRGIGSGLGTVEAGLRLRYDVTRRFAPYVGIVSARAFARTADFRRKAGEGIDDTRLVAGLRFWF
jgi:copper resistance protein B